MPRVGEEEEVINPDIGSLPKIQTLKQYDNFLPKEGAMEGLICNSSLTKTEIGKMKIGQKLLLRTKEGYCSLLAQVSVFGNLGFVGCEVKIEKILDLCTENISKEGDVIWAAFHDLAVLN